MRVATLNLRLAKAVRTGEQACLMTLFDSAARFRYFELREPLLEGERVTLVIGPLGSVTLPVGSDMNTGQKKTLMTSFWYSERIQPFEVRRDMAVGDELTIEMSKNP